MIELSIEKVIIHSKAHDSQLNKLTAMYDLNLISLLLDRNVKVSNDARDIIQRFVKDLVCE